MTTAMTELSRISIMSVFHLRGNAFIHLFLSLFKLLVLSCKATSYLPPHPVFKSPQALTTPILNLEIKLGVPIPPHSAYRTSRTFKYAADISDLNWRTVCCKHV